MTNPMKMLNQLSSKQKMMLGIGFVAFGYVMFRWQRDAKASTLSLGTQKLPTQFGAPGVPSSFWGAPASKPKATPATPVLSPQAQAAIAQNESARQDEVYRSQMADLGGAGSSGLWGI